MFRSLWTAVLLSALAASPLAAQDLTVAIDVKPRDAVNAINIHAHGLTPVAVLCSASFDPTQVAPGSVGLRALRETPPPVLVGERHCALEDVSGDGCPDLVCHFSTAALALTCADRLLLLQATLLDGSGISGQDKITPRPCPKPGKP